MTRIPPMLCIPHRIPDCPECISTHTTLRKPLSDEALRQMWAAYAPVVGGVLEFARSIERAHGIGDSK